MILAGRLSTAFGLIFMGASARTEGGSVIPKRAYSRPASLRHQQPD
jgi:hypothetical protein